MKKTTFILAFIFSCYAIGQGTVTSGVYKFTDPDSESVLMKGETTHFSGMKFSVVKIKAADDETLVYNEAREQIIIIKEGEVNVKLNDTTKIIGPNSVVFVHPDDNCLLRSETPEAVYYTMAYSSKKPANLKRGLEAGGSFIVDFDEVEYKPHDKGGIRNYFHTQTAMCPYYEMHITNLNAGIKSHEPHTHHAAEIVVMINGNTEMEIGDSIYKGTTGDVYYLASNIPHAIKNIGDTQCMYFAFQWD